MPSLLGEHHQPLMYMKVASSPMTLRQAYGANIGQHRANSLWSLLFKKKSESNHDDVIKWKHFRVTGSLWEEFTGHRWIYPHEGQWHGALMFSLIYAWTNVWANHRDAGNLRPPCTHYGFNVGTKPYPSLFPVGLQTQRPSSNRLLWPSRCCSILLRTEDLKYTTLITPAL